MTSSYDRCHDRTRADDLVLLEEISEQSIVRVLDLRYSTEDIYTNIGPVLVVVNPYRLLHKDGKSVYDSDVAQLYSRKVYIEVAPHIFSVSAEAYRNMMAEFENQCIIVSGESGSGKTEASKQIMQYLTHVGSHNSAEIQGLGLEQIKRQLLESNPVLEAFGNAQTVRNDNSSRFGKYMELQFNFRGDVVGGKITNYLLEKSRVIHQANGERNFHIFHQLVKGASAEERSQLQLESATNFAYLMRQDRTINGVDDAAEFNAVKNSMTIVGIPTEEQAQIFSLLSGILWLGNVEFTGDERSEVADTHPLEIAAQLLGCETASLERSLVSRVFQASSRASVSEVRLDPSQARFTRDTLAKTIYQRSFNWLVARINSAINQENPKNVTLGILDIYGFEIFEENSFEQFCINWVNERLQQIFIELTLKAEQDEYDSEGIEWTHIDYFNNQVVCDLIERKPGGIVSLLDEQCAFKEATVDGLSASFSRNLGDHPHYKTSTSSADVKFTIVHYAGEVEYNPREFIEKNRDTLYNDLLELMQRSSNTLAQELFEDSRSESEKQKRPPSAATQFKTQVTALMQTLLSAKPHYVRCIKPNDEKRAGLFNAERVQHQVRYLGLTENVRVRRAGFCYRELYNAFIRRYKMLAPGVTWPNPPPGTDVKDAVEALLNHLGFTRGEEFRLGSSKVFIREPTTLFRLEELRVVHVRQIATKVQAQFRRYKQQKDYIRTRECFIRLEALARGFIGHRRFQRQKHCSIRIQARIRVFIMRARFKVLRRQHYACIGIQARWRGYHERSAFSEELKKRLALAHRRRLETEERENAYRIFQETLSKGIELTKHPRPGMFSGKPKRHVIHYDLQSRHITWDGKHGESGITSSDVSDVVLGIGTDAFTRSLSKHYIDESKADFCFSIVAADRTLDLETDSVEQRDDLYRGFRRLCLNDIVFPPHHLQPGQEQ